jgi:hypothetical protein
MTKELGLSKPANRKPQTAALLVQISGEIRANIETRKIQQPYKTEFMDQPKKRYTYLAAT